MEKPHELTPSPKMLELYGKFSEAREKDIKSKTWDNFDSVAKSVLFECVGWVEKEHSAKVPPLRVKLLNQRQFEELVPTSG